MGFSIHPFVVILNKDNYESWKKGILTHLRWFKLFPYLYGLIPKLDIPWKQSIWGNNNDHVVGLIGTYIGVDIPVEISGIECPYTLWTNIWEIFRDHHISSFPNDHVADCLLPLNDANNIPYDDDTLEEVEYNKCLECPVDKETSLLASPPPVEITSSSTVAFIDDCGATDMASSDSLQ